YTLSVVRSILEYDKKNEYILYYNSGKDISANLPEFKADNARIEATRYPNKVYNYLLAKILNFPKIDRLLGVDVFFMPHINFISLTSNVKSVLTVHDLSFLRHKEFFSTRKNVWHKILNVKKIIRFFKRVFAVSEHTKYDIIDLCGIEEEKIRVIPSGIGDEFMLLPKSDQRLKQVAMKYDLPEKFVLYLGNIEPRKNISGLIRSFDLLLKENKDLQDHRLILAGAKVCGYKRAERLRQRLKHKNKIRFLGYVEKEDKVYLYNLAKLFVYPSFYEGFGFPPLEAMACGVPVLTSHATSLPEVTGSAAITINPYNARELTLVMAEMLRNNILRQSLINKGLERATNYKIKDLGAKYFNVLTH
ncbi:glycosyltransferase family 4 protein, partial [bacterium]|nr:glycosyltransferase family 4 protein [bacterium]